MKFSRYAIVFLSEDSFAYPKIILPGLFNIYHVFKLGNYSFHEIPSND